MTATLTPLRVTQPPEFDMEQLRDGLANATAGGSRELDGLEVPPEYHEHVGLYAWEQDVVDAAIEEVLPHVAALLSGAIQRRLPWEWEPDR